MTVIMIVVYSAFTILPASGSYVSFGVAHIMSDELVARPNDLQAIARSAVTLYAGSYGAVLQQLVGALKTK